MSYILVGKIYKPCAALLRISFNGFSKVYSIYYTSVTHIIFVTQGYDFRKDGRYFVLAERRDGKDYLGVYDCDNSFKMMKVSFS
jgi:hypothetical protein